MTTPMKPRFAPRDPETMDPMGPQNHPLNPSDDPDMVALAKRIRRKCEIMRLDAPRDSAIRHDLAELITLADIIARRAGADDV